MSPVEAAVLAGVVGTILGLLLGILGGAIWEHRRLQQFVQEERDQARAERDRADRAVDQLTALGGGEPISNEAIQKMEDRNAETKVVADQLYEVFSDEVRQDDQNEPH